jgi:hypothetical protein
MSVDDEEMKATHQSRKLRLQALMDEINENKKILITEITKFAMNKWWVSARIIDTYLKELVASGNYRITTEAEGEYIEHIGGN